MCSGGSMFISLLIALATLPNIDQDFCKTTSCDIYMGAIDE